MVRLAVSLRVLALGLVPVALLLSHRNLTVVTTLIALSGVGVMTRGWRAARPPVWAWCALALAGYLALSSAWTPSAADRDWALRIPLFALTAVAVIAAARPGAGAEPRAFALAVLIGCLLLGFEGATGGLIRDVLPPENRSNRDDVSTARGVGLAGAMLPAGAWWLHRLYGRGGAWLSGLAAAALALAALRFDIAVNLLALEATLGAALLAWRAPKATAVAVLCALGAAFLLVPLAAAVLPPADALAALTDGPVSWRQRLVIWRTVADAALADPRVFLLGAGQQASVALGEAAGTVALAGAAEPLPRVPTHPHSVFLQVWYEAGALGSALAGAAFALAAARLRRASVPPGVLIALAATLAGALVSLAVDASLWTLWRASALLLAGWGLILADRAVRA